MAKKEEKSPQARVIEYWAKHPRKFVEEALQVAEISEYGISSQQLEALDAIGTLVESKIKLHGGRKLTKKEAEYANKIGLSIMSGRGTGKDAFASWMVIWFLFCFPWPKIRCTANTSAQLKSVLWAEISKWLRGAIPLVRSTIQWQAERIYNKEAWKVTGGRSEWFAEARTVNVKSTPEEQAEVLSGLHEDYLMLVADEVSGIPDPVMRNIEATLTQKCNFVLMIFNPTRATGYAVDSHGANAKDWIKLNWDSRESELVKTEWVDRYRDKYGEDSDPWRINVLGVPPNSSEDTLIPRAWVEDAVTRPIEASDADPLIYTVDVGAGGDPSILMKFLGRTIIEIKRYNTKDTIELAEKVSIEMYKDNPDAVAVDVIGLGNGVYNTLRRRHSKVFPVDVSRTARNPDRFRRVRDELWWRTRESFEHGNIKILDDPELKDELCVLKYDDSSGVVIIESKKSLKKRSEHSPDMGDCVMMFHFFENRIFNEQAKRRAMWREDKTTPEPQISWRGI